MVGSATGTGTMKGVAPPSPDSLAKELIAPCGMNCGVCIAISAIARPVQDATTRTVRGGAMGSLEALIRRYCSGGSRRTATGHIGYHMCGA